MKYRYRNFLIILRYEENFSYYCRSCRYCPVWFVCRTAPIAVSGILDGTAEDKTYNELNFKKGYTIDKAVEKAEKNIDIITTDVVDLLHEKAVLERAHGGRGVGNMLEREFLNPLANYICTLPDTPSVLKCHPGENGIEFEVMLSEN